MREENQACRSLKKKRPGWTPGRFPTAAVADAEAGRLEEFVVETRTDRDSVLIQLRAGNFSERLPVVNARSLAGIA